MLNMLHTISVFLKLNCPMTFTTSIWSYQWRWQL